MSSRSALHYSLPILLFAVLVGCAVNPDTGRVSINAITESEEIEAGAYALNQLRGTSPICRDMAMQSRARAVGMRIARVSGRAHLPWEFVVIEHPEVNAVSFPGGKIAIMAGLMHTASDDDMLAAVLAHEIAHVALKHSAQSMTNRELNSGVLGAVTAPFRSVSAQPMGLSGGIHTESDLKREYEADALGIRLMARAGYRPEAAVAFWLIMARSASPQYLNAHPASVHRLGALTRFFPEAKQLETSASR
jgi:metalloendopeptidase OMA1, mitochondrial